ncbi:UPAR/Ly6 domain-containing protein crok-like [Periplaneta americana]|uniref:UPAR/Ly6 domain-containing protein crok-like n=1 Tax=Periplaneta americana TaxID=6978 RepID=UPI0037E82F4B
MKMIYMLLLSPFFCCADAIKCYQCRTDRDADCGSPKPHPDYLKECPLRPDFPGNPFCRSIYQILYFTKDSDTAVIRECGYKRHRDRDCYQSKWANDVYQVTCDCNREACNTGVRPLCGLTAGLVLLRALVQNNIANAFRL